MHFHRKKRNAHELIVTVTAPAGTLHEAFFDPVALSGGGVGATGSSGVIDPEEFTVAGDDVEIDEPGVAERIRGAGAG